MGSRGCERADAQERKRHIRGTLTATDGNGGESDGDGMHGGNGVEGDAELPMINPVDLPQTGDSSNPVLWLALLGLARAGMLLWRRKAHG